MTRSGRRWRRFSVGLVKPPMLVLTRHEWHGAEHLPPGGMIIVANHVSHFDPFVLAHFVYEAGRWPRFLAKASLFEIPVIGDLMRAVRQIPVHRGSTNAVRALDAAVEAVRAGGVVIIYPEGTTTRDPDLWPMRGKTGFARLAMATGAPIVPVVTWGPQRVFDPRTKRLRLRPMTPVTVVAGPPVDCSPWLAATAGGDGTRGGGAAAAAAVQELTDAVMRRLRDMLAEIRRTAAADVPVEGEARA
jgi:1-acyl-sn-glycerol-3-phosphate acyltransferase